MHRRLSLVLLLILPLSLGCANGGFAKVAGGIVGAIEGAHAGAADIANGAAVGIETARDTVARYETAGEDASPETITALTLAEGANLGSIVLSTVNIVRDVIRVIQAPGAFGFNKAAQLFRAIGGTAPGGD